MTTLYIVGPVTREDDNIAAFNAAAECLRGLGFKVLNPAERAAGRPRAEYMAQSVLDVSGSCGIYLLPGWRSCDIACLEVAIACELCLPFMLHIGAQAPTEGMKLELLLKDRRED